MVRMMTFEPMKCAAILNNSPPSFANMQALMLQCTIKKEIKKRPVVPIKNLRPIEDDNQLLIFIVLKNLCQT